MRQERPFTAALGSGENVHGPIGEVRELLAGQDQTRGDLDPKDKDRA